MALFTILAVASAAFKVGSALFGLGAAKKEKSAAKREAKARRLQKFIEQRRLLREARQARATALSTGVSQGVGIESSGVQGVLSSIQTQARDQLKTSSIIGLLERQAAARKRSAADKRAIGGLLSGLGSAAGSLSEVVPGKTTPATTKPIRTTTIETETGVTERPSGGNINTSVFTNRGG